MAKRVITLNDCLIFELLKDPNYRVQKDGRFLTKLEKNGKHVGSKWRPCGSVNHTRNKTKCYWKVSYKGRLLYAHRIVWAKFKGWLSEALTINHKDLNGLNNKIDNLEHITPGENLSHAYILKNSVKGFRKMGMSAAEARAAWGGNGSKKTY